jgi:hypothetical protein
MLRCTCSPTPRPILGSTTRVGVPVCSGFPSRHSLSTSASSTSRPRPATLSKRIKTSHQRWISDEQHFRTRFGNLKVNLVRLPNSRSLIVDADQNASTTNEQKSKGAVGVAQSRGERPFVPFSPLSLALPRQANLDSFTQISRRLLLSTLGGVAEERSQVERCRRSTRSWMESDFARRFRR